MARIRNKEIGFVFQTFNLLARATSLHNVELPLIYNGTPAAERIERAKQALADVGLESRMIPQAQRALRRPAPARGHRPRAGQQPLHHPGRRAHRATSTPRPASRSWPSSISCTPRGNTIVLVTHEPDIAEYAHRVVHIRDGQIFSDEPSKRFRR